MFVQRVWISGHKLSYHRYVTWLFRTKLKMSLLSCILLPGRNWSYNWSSSPTQSLWYPHRGGWGHRHWCTPTSVKKSVVLLPLWSLFQAGHHHWPSPTCKTSSNLPLWSCLCSGSEMNWPLVAHIGLSCISTRGLAKSFPGFFHFS